MNRYTVVSVLYSSDDEPAPVLLLIHDARCALCAAAAHGDDDMDADDDEFNCIINFE
jgi:hypothetical protein